MLTNSLKPIDFPKESSLVFQNRIRNEKVYFHSFLTWLYKHGVLSDWHGHKFIIIMGRKFQLNQIYHHLQSSFELHEK